LSISMEQIFEVSLPFLIHDQNPIVQIVCV
jgi:hypothetical protein